jgi:hypothetical protein
MKPSEYLGMLWPPAIMPVNADSVDNMMRIAENQAWLLKHATIYDRRAWWFLAFSTGLMLLTPLALALLIPATHIRWQVSRMIRFAREQQDDIQDKN